MVTSVQFTGEYDWGLLRTQKQALLRLTMERCAPSDVEITLLDGVIAMIDAIQDQAANVLGQDVIFAEGDDL